MSIFKGSGVAIVTPFNESGVDFKKLKELVELLGYSMNDTTSKTIYEILKEEKVK